MPEEQGVTGMHTFFINTSKKSLQDYEVLFDIPKENSAFVSLEVPLSDWLRKESGDAGCVQKMNDLIDGYAELNDAFNLILYVDLSEQPAYTSIPRDDTEGVSRNAMLQALETVLMHMVCQRIVVPLIDAGRKPQDVLIMFGSDQRFCGSIGGNADARFERVSEKLYALLGMPEDEKIVQCAKEIPEGEPKARMEAFVKAIKTAYKAEGIPGLREQYAPMLKAWCESVVTAKNLSTAKTDLLQSMHELKSTEMQSYNIRALVCPYDFVANDVNQKVRALNRLNIALHLLKCVRANTIFFQKEVSVYSTEEETPAASDAYHRELIPFRVYEARQIGESLAVRKAVFDDTLEWLKKRTQQYSELELAPSEWWKFKHADFGLDDLGDAAEEKNDEDVEAEEVQSGNKKQKRNQEENRQAQTGGRAVRDLLAPDYQVLDYDMSKITVDLLHKQKTAAAYKQQAEKLRKEHVRYLKTLKMNITLRLSNYAGKSKENKQAVLKVGGYQYAGRNTADREKEDRPIAVVQPIANTAYNTIFNRFMAFCAGRSVEVTDIQEPYERYIRKVDQIEQSLKNIKKVALGMLVAIPVLYIPYAAIQFSSITESLLTVCCAAGSVGIPLGLLYGGLSVLALRQRKRYLDEGKILTAASNAVLEQKNKPAAQDFDRLLADAIPALRWVYEYKLDAAYYSDCCEIADAKINHHKSKLSERRKFLENVLVDLEYTPRGKVGLGNEPEKKPECSKPYCTGENREVYIITDEVFWNKIDGKGR